MAFAGIIQAQAIVTSGTDKFYFHSGGSGFNQLDSATFDTTAPTGNSDAGGGGIGFFGPSASWSGHLGGPIDSLSLDFWQKSAYGEQRDSAVTYSTTLTVDGTDYGFPDFDADVAASPDVTEVTHTFTTTDDGTPLPINVESETTPVTISIVGRWLNLEAAWVIVYDSTTHPSGFAVTYTTFTPPGPIHECTATSGTNFQICKAAPQNGGGEPSVAIDPTADNRIYVSYPGNSMYLYRSEDGGESWLRAASPQDFSGDTSVNVDSSGAVYESNLGGEGLQDQLQADVFKSLDHGETFLHGDGFAVSSNTTNSPFLVDRQWTDSYIPPGGTTDTARVYISYHDWAPNQIWVNVSTDGGRTFGPPIDVITAPDAEAASFCDTIPGGTKVVPATAPADQHPGRVYVAWLAADLPTNLATGCNLTQLNTFHSLWIAWSDDEGQTWSNHLIYDGGIGHDASALFADLTLDNQGNPYVAFGDNLTGEWDMYVEASFDGGTTWNGQSDGSGEAYKVNSDTGTHFFPAIAVGDPGKVDVAYIATDTQVPVLAYGKTQPGGDANAKWYTYVAQSLDLLSGNPTWTVTKVTPDPIHTGDVCVLGIFCTVFEPVGADRSLLDFIDIAVDAEGMAHAVYTANQTADTAGIYIANQTGGPSVVTPAKADTALTVSVGKKTLSAVLTSGGQPLAGRTIQFFVNDAPVGSAVTNATGTASVARPKSLRKGDTVKAVFGGDGSYNGSEASVTVKK